MKHTILNQIIQNIYKIQMSKIMITQLNITFFIWLISTSNT